MGNKIKKTKNLSFYARIAIILLIVGYIIIAYPGFYPIPKATGSLVAKILSFINIKASSNGTYLLVAFPGYSRILELSAECSGIVLFSLFALIAFIVPDIPMKHRFLILPLIPLLFVFNLGRIILGIVLGYNISVDFLVFFHNTLGQVFMFFGAILIYMLWLSFLGHFPTERRHYNEDMNF